MAQCGDWGSSKRIYRFSVPWEYCDFLHNSGFEPGTFWSNIIQSWVLLVWRPRGATVARSNHVGVIYTGLAGWISLWGVAKHDDRGRLRLPFNVGSVWRHAFMFCLNEISDRLLLMKCKETLRCNTARIQIMSGSHVSLSLHISLDYFKYIIYELPFMHIQRV